MAVRKVVVVREPGGRKTFGRQCTFCTELFFRAWIMNIVPCTQESLQDSASVSLWHLCTFVTLMLCNRDGEQQLAICKCQEQEDVTLSMVALSVSSNNLSFCYVTLHDFLQQPSESCRPVQVLCPRKLASNSQHLLSLCIGEVACRPSPLPLPVTTVAGRKWASGRGARQSVVLHTRPVTDTAYLVGDIPAKKRCGRCQQFLSDYTF